MPYTPLFLLHSHDASDSIDSALESSAAGIRAVKISLLILGATAIAQIVIVAISGSVALLADTIHNFADALTRSEEHTSELQSLMRLSYAVLCLKKKQKLHTNHNIEIIQ